MHYLNRLKTYEPHHEKTCLCHMRTTIGTDQPVHPHSLISTLIVHCLGSIIPILAKSKLNEQAGLCLNWLKTPKTGFLMTWLSYNTCCRILCNRN